MTTNEKGRTAASDATQNDHTRDCSAHPRISKYRQKMIGRALAEVAERPLALALLTALNGRAA